SPPRHSCSTTVASARV
ncbi:hypothetical protein ECPA49_4830, partial [Escherichia coli PA49]